jgi:aspartate ammonia-lyase
MDFRTAQDSLGSKDIPSESLYGINTYRAIHNFGYDFPLFHPEIIAAVVEIKKCAAFVNGSEGFISIDKSQAIVDACSALLDDRSGYATLFPLPALQGGAGTSTHMNVNEVIANMALQKLGKRLGEYEFCHPNDDVNKFQSTNDVMPTALRMAAIRLLDELATALADLQTSFQNKENEFADVLKPGRTEYAGSHADHSRSGIRGLRRGIRARSLARFQGRRKTPDGQFRRHRRRNGFRGA